MTREEKLETALKQSREQFQLYGDLHRSKTPPQVEKAKANYAMVGMINTALASEDDVLVLTQATELGTQGNAA